MLCHCNTRTNTTGATMHTTGKDKIFLQHYCNYNLPHHELQACNQFYFWLPHHQKTIFSEKGHKENYFAGKTSYIRYLHFSNLRSWQATASSKWPLQIESSGEMPCFSETVELAPWSPRFAVNMKDEIVTHKFNTSQQIYEYKRNIHIM